MSNMIQIRFNQLLCTIKGIIFKSLFLNYAKENLHQR